MKLYHRILGGLTVINNFTFLLFSFNSPNQKANFLYSKLVYFICIYRAEHQNKTKIHDVTSSGNFAILKYLPKLLYVCVCDLFEILA